jgi:hypothetical protein
MDPPTKAPPQPVTHYYVAVSTAEQKLVRHPVPAPHTLRTATPRRRRRSPAPPLQHTLVELAGALPSDQCPSIAICCG